MIKSFKIEINATNEEWSLFEQSDFYDPVTIEIARDYIKEARLDTSFLIYTDSSGLVDVLVDFNETVCYKVTYEIFS